MDDKVNKEQTVNEEETSDDEYIPTEEEVYEASEEDFHTELDKLKYKMEDLIESIIAYAEDCFCEIYEKNMNKEGEDKQDNETLIENLVDKVENALCYRELKETDRLTHTYRGFLEKERERE